LALNDASDGDRAGATLSVWTGVLSTYALAFPANAANAAQTAIPASSDFVMIVHSIVAKRCTGSALPGYLDFTNRFGPQHCGCTIKNGVVAGQSY
jgi:hypothetical protein